MSTPAYDFERVAEDLMAVAANVRIGEVFGSPTILADGKAVAALDEETGGMAFKLGDGAGREEALALPGAGPWDARRTGEPVRGWVLVPHDGADAWGELARQAVEPHL